jgi:hypothetical protein
LLDRYGLGNCIRRRTFHVEDCVFTHDPRQSPRRVTLEATAEGVLVLLSDTVSAEASRVENCSMAADRDQFDRVIRQQCVKEITVNRRVVKDGWTDGHIQQGALGQLRCGCGKFFAQIDRSRLSCLELNLNQICRMDLDVIVGVVDAGNHGSPAEIDPTSARASQRFDLLGIANGNDSFTPDRQRLNVRMVSVTRENLSVEQNEIGRRRLSCYDCRPTQCSD